MCLFLSMTVLLFWIQSSNSQLYGGYNQNQQYLGRSSFLNPLHDGPLNGPFGHIPAPSEQTANYNPGYRFRTHPSELFYDGAYPQTPHFNHANYGGYPNNRYRNVANYGSPYVLNYGGHYPYQHRYSYGGGYDGGYEQPGMLKGAFDGAVKGVLAGAFGL